MERQLLLNKMMLLNGDETIFPFHERNGLSFLFNGEQSTACKCRSIDEWHRGLGHCNKKDEQYVDGMNIEKVPELGKSECQTFVKAKFSQSLSRIPREKSDKPLQLVHADLAGPVNPVGTLGYKYVALFSDDFSGMLALFSDDFSGMHFVCFLKEKSQAHEALVDFLADSQSFGVVKVLRSDGGMEFMGENFQRILKEKSIRHETSCPHSPHQNGTAERTLRTLFEMARCLILEASLPKSLWPYAIQCAAYIRNRCYSDCNSETPLFLMTGKRPNLARMHIFGSECYALTHTSKGKLDERGAAGIFARGYRC
jgi:hypothetical protein